MASAESPGGSLADLFGIRPRNRNRQLPALARSTPHVVGGRDGTPYNFRRQGHGPATFKGCREDLSAGGGPHLPPPPKRPPGGRTPCRDPRPHRAACGGAAPHGAPT